MGMGQRIIRILELTMNRSPKYIGYDIFFLLLTILAFLILPESLVSSYLYFIV